MEYYHYTDKQTFSKVHFDMMLPQCTLFESRIEVKTRFMPRAGKPATRTILMECYFLDAFKQRHSFEDNNYIFVNDIICPKDGGEIKAKDGMYGVYVRFNCEHNLRLDEI